MAMKVELIDELLKGVDPKTALTEDGLFGELKKALAERILNAELSHHLAVEDRPEGSNNCRNGYSQKTVETGSGPLELAIPRDRAGTFDPQLIGKYQRRFPGFDQKVISLYARGMTVREIQSHLLEIYGTEVAAGLISTITDAVLDEVKHWQNRPLDRCYPVIYFDAIRVKIRDEGLVRNKAVYLALGVRGNGTKDVLGLWIEQTEGAKFWLKVVNELRNRGVEDVLIAVVDGLTGFPDAIQAVYPDCQVQGCIVHLIRNSLQFVGWKERRAVAGALKSIYQAVSAAAAKEALHAFAQGPWGQRYPAIAPLWERRWEQVIPFFAFPPEVRRILYTTNAIESLHSQVRRAVRQRGHFPSDEAASKLIYLVVREMTKDWNMPAREWYKAKTQFAILFGERFELANE